MNKTLKISTTALAVTAALVLPSAALANSSQEGYGGPNNVVVPIQETPPTPPTPPAPAPEQTTAPAPAEVTQPAVNDVADTTAASPAPVATTAPAAETSSLPFTGADLGVLAVIGALMLAFGFGLRRLTHSPSQS